MKSFKNFLAKAMFLAATLANSAQAADTGFYFRYNVAGPASSLGTPDPVTFMNVSGVEPSSSQTSNSVSISGISKSVVASVSGSGSPLLSADGGATWNTQATVGDGSSLKLKATASSKFSTKASVAVSIGTRKASWSITTWPVPAPDAFNFVNLIDQVPLSVQQSNVVTLSGFSGNIPVSIETGGAGATLRVNGGAWTQTAEAKAGDTLQVKATAPASANSVSNVLVRAGALVETWSIATAATKAPDAFVFTDLIDQTPETTVPSNEVTLSGFTGTLTATVSGPADAATAMSVNSGAYVDTATVKSGDKIKLRAKTAAGSGNSISVAVSVGSTSSTWKVTNRVEQNAAPFTFADLIDQEPNTTVSSNQVQISGFTGKLTASISADAGADAKIRIDSGPWVTSADIQSGQMLQAQVKSSSATSTTVDAIVSVGSVSDTWSVKSWDLQQPLAFAFTDVVDQEPDKAITSDIVTLTGFRGNLPISVSSDAAAAALVSINGGSWISNGNVSAGDKVRIQAKTSQTVDTKQDVLVTVGGVADTWSITTWPQQHAVFEVPSVAGVTANDDVATAFDVTGFRGKLTATISTDVGTNAALSNDGMKTWSPTLSLSAGDIIWYRVHTLSGQGVLHTVTVTIGPDTQTATLRTAAKVVYAAATAGTSWTVPVGVKAITVKTWGAGGGGATHGSVGTIAGGSGGGGGYAKSVLAVTPGETLTFKVGGGGAGSSNATWAGGGGGGGYSGVFRGSTPLLIAGGGGGGTSNVGLSSSMQGGGGGGTNGTRGFLEADSSNLTSPTANGGTQTAGGDCTLPGNGLGTTYCGNNGSSYQGGGGGAYGAIGNGAAGGLNGGGAGGISLSTMANGGAGGGGGGGGYFGGAGGGFTASGTVAKAGGGAGGGSGYATGFSIVLTTSTTQAAANLGDPDLAGSAGSGGAGVTTRSGGGAGKPGLLVISY